MDVVQTLGARVQRDPLLAAWFRSAPVAAVVYMVLAGHETPDLVVEHDPVDGTTIQTHNRQWNEQIKALRYPRFVWSGSRTAWFVQGSADRALPPWPLERIATALRAAGATVAVKVHEGEVRSVAEREADRKERAEDRAERFSGYAGSAAGRSDSALKRAHDIGERFAMGQPILVGHHSEKGARADQARIHGSMRRAITESNKAEHWQERAAGVEQAAERRERPDVVNRRIETLGTELRGIERRLGGEPSWRDGLVVIKPTGEHLARLLASKADIEAQIAHWQGQLGAQGLRSWGPNDFRVGDPIGHGVVIRVGDKSVTALVGSHTRNEYGRTLTKSELWTNPVEYKRIKPTNKPDPGEPEPFEAKGTHPRAKLIEAIYSTHVPTDARVRLGWKHGIGVIAPAPDDHVNLVVLEDLPDDALLALAADRGLEATAKKAPPHHDAKLITAIWRAWYSGSRGRKPDGRIFVSIRPWEYGPFGRVKQSEYEHSQDLILETLTDDQRVVLAGMVKPPLDVAALRAKK
jgi:uncharacterized protein DUF3560